MNRLAQGTITYPCSNPSFVTCIDEDPLRYDDNADEQSSKTMIKSGGYITFFLPSSTSM